MKLRSSDKYLYALNLRASTKFSGHGQGCSHHLRWLETVSSTYILMGRYNYSLSFDATIMVSKNCPTIAEHVVIIFVVTIATVLLAKNTLHYSFRGV